MSRHSLIATLAYIAHFWLLPSTPALDCVAILLCPCLPPPPQLIHLESHLDVPPPPALLQPVPCLPHLSAHTNITRPM
eukprot:13988009-Ditylum_brightwellii.AAC.1